MKKGDYVETNCLIVQTKNKRDYNLLAITPYFY